jgi:hypothetical protein
VKVTAFCVASFSAKNQSDGGSFGLLMGCGLTMLLRLSENLKKASTPRILKELSMLNVVNWCG